MSRKTSNIVIGVSVVTVGLGLLLPKEKKVATIVMGFVGCIGLLSVAFASRKKEQENG